MKVKLHKPELVILLKEKLLELDKLCSLFDSGNSRATISIAKIINDLFRNTENSKSLLNQLKLNHVPIFCSAELYNPKSLINYMGLLSLKRKAEHGWNYFPKLNELELKHVSQDNWWQNKKIMIDSIGTPYTRAKILKSVSTNDNELENMDTSGWKINGRSDIKINPIPNIVRQITFELLASFKEIDISKESKLHYKSNL